MAKEVTYLMSFVLFMTLISCATNRAVDHSPTTTATGPRTIILDGESFSEKEAGDFKTWNCRDISNRGPILVEVGLFSDPILKEFGFILYDGGNTGTITLYERTGLDHRWDWGPNLTDYSFILKTDGTGLYYDFTTVTKGEPTTARDLYKCFQK
jgi:hypothetical protein